MEAGDKNWAHNYINNPLTAPDPSDETGPGSSLRREPDVKQPSTPRTPPHSSGKRLSKNNPYRRSYGSPKETSATNTKEVRPTGSYPSPPPSASPRYSPSPGHRREASGSSLKERFPGDPSVNPLDQLSKEKAVADKARHVTKKHAVRPDTIDNLDNSGLGSYHHEGPYDATLFARNNSWGSSPVAAVTSTNKEALRATPREKVIDSVERHRPLDGVAAYAPGETDRNGHTYRYQQGDNMMVAGDPEGGAYKRWPGVQYHPDDIKGKGEPSYSIEKALKDHSLNEKTGHSKKASLDGEGGIEMATRNRSGSGVGANENASRALKAEAFADEGTGGGQMGRSLSNRLKKRVGSLKKKLQSDE